MNEIRHRHFEVWKVSDTTYGITTNKVHLMRKLNIRLQRYPKSTKFVPGDEPVFFFNESQVAYIRSLITRQPKKQSQKSTPLPIA